ncbi:hypothetical protein BST61_g6070 [Cercospora zeina]
MLARTAQLPAWTKQAHVCRACRRQWQIERACPRRWQSHSANLTYDQWFALNDINDEFGGKQSAAPQPSKDREDEEQKKSKNRRDKVQVSEKGTATRPDGVPAPDLELLRSSLSKALPGQDGSQDANEISKRKDAVFKAAFLSGRSQHRDYKTSQDSTAHPGVVSANSDLMASLLVELEADTKTNAVQQDAGMSRPVEEVEDDVKEDMIRPIPRDTGPRPFPSFRGASSSTTPSVQVHVDKEPDVASNGSVSPKVWRAKTSPADRGLGGPISPGSLSGKPSPLIDRHRETHPRNAWGASHDASSSLPSKVTYKSLVEADRTSAPKRASGTPTGKHPFGIVDTVGAVWRGAWQPGRRDEPQPPLDNEQKEPLTAERMGDMESLRSRILNSIELRDSSTEAVEPNVTRNDAEGIAPVDSAAATSLQLLYATRAQPPNDVAGKMSPESNSTLGSSVEKELRLRRRIQLLEQRRPSSQNRATIKSNIRVTRKRLRVFRQSREQNIVANDADTVDPSPETTSSPTSSTMSAANDGDTVDPSPVTTSSPTSITMPAVIGTSIGEAMKSGRVPPKPTRKTRRPSRVARRVSSNATGSASIKSEEATDNKEPGENDDAETEDGSQVDLLSIRPSELQVQALDIPQPPVPYLEYGLDRVLFNPGVYQLQDATSRVYNFDPYLQQIMPVEQFDFNSLKEYKTSSEDTALSAIANQESARYIGSTSSMTGSLTHFHYLISNWRSLNLEVLSYGYAGGGKPPIAEFTKINKAPSAIFLRWKNGCYAIDADKEFDSPNVLMLLGKSMELLLTLPKDEYEKYRKSHPRMVSEEQRSAPESYKYSTMGDFLMRSQLDAYDPRLPGNGTFDLKTRAVVSVRMSSRDHEEMTGYEIYGNHGRWNSYEKEFHDMARATMLKYMLQARMGMMNGIFVAYHNVKRMFGFQYVPISEMDRVLHGQSDACLGDQEFKASLRILNELLNRATTRYPEQSLRIHFETQAPGEGDKGTPATLHMYAEPMTESEIQAIQDRQKDKISEYERKIMGKEDVSGVNEEDDADSRQEEDDATALARSSLKYTSTDTPADQPFLNDVQDTHTSELKPLFYAQVLVQSRVNGHIPQDGRPQSLKADDTWELDYLVKEFEVSRDSWARYDDARARRKQALRFDDDEADAAEGEGKVKEDDGYIKFLKELSRKGVEAREKQDLADAESGQPVLRVDEPLPRHREKIETLEDYLAWMYRREQA